MMEELKMNNNTFKCNVCKSFLIFEELQTHKCYEMLDEVLFDTDGTFSLDGKKWYHFSPTESQQRNKTTEDSTEPNLILTKKKLTKALDSNNCGGLIKTMKF
jgi:hypothetical protein